MKITAKSFTFFFASIVTIFSFLFSASFLTVFSYVCWLCFFFFSFRKENTNLVVVLLLAFLFLFISRQTQGLFLLMIFGCCSFLEDILFTFLNKKRISSFPTDQQMVTLFDQKTKNYHSILLSDVKVDDIIVVKPGEMILVDGIITRGRTLLKCFSTSSRLTKKKGDFVFAGDQNLEKEIYVQVQKEVSTFSFIQLRDKIRSDFSEHKWYYSIPFWFSILFFILLFLALIFLFTHSFSRLYFISTCLFLLLIHPFTLLLRIIPLLMSIRFEKQGIYILRSSSLFDLFFTENIIFTKTGILTLGDFTVEKVITEEENDFFYYLNCALVNHEDRLATCIREYRPIHVDQSRIRHYQFHDGGHSFDYMEHKILVGNYRFMEKHDVVVEKLLDVGTILYVAVDGEAIGVIVVADKIKMSLKNEISKLKDLGIKHFGTFSHDDERVVYAVSRTLGIKDSYSRLDAKRWQFWLQYFEQTYGTKTLFISDCIEKPWAQVNWLMNGISAKLENSDIMIVDNDMSKVVILFQDCHRIKVGFKKIIKWFLFSKGCLLFCFLFVTRNFYYILILNLLSCLPIVVWLSSIYFEKRR